MSDFKLLTLDIETSPADVWAWGMWQQNIPPAFIKQPTRVITWAAKWEHEDYVYSSTEWDHGHEDMILNIHELVDAADAIVTYNGISFDMKHLNREFIEMGLEPPSPYKNIDLLRVVKRMFKFPHNKLDYVVQVLLGEHKLETGGISLWLDALSGNRAAQKMMEDYNIKDVLLTEALYHKVQGWVPSHPNRALWIEDQDDPTCPNCGSKHVQKRGIEYPARVNAYQRYKCMECGANARGRDVLHKAERGVLV